MKVLVILFLLGIFSLHANELSENNSSFEALNNQDENVYLSSESVQSLENNMTSRKFTLRPIKYLNNFFLYLKSWSNDVQSLSPALGTEHAIDTVWDVDLEEVVVDQVKSAFVHDKRNIFFLIIKKLHEFWKMAGEKKQSQRSCCQRNNTPNKILVSSGNY